MFRGRCGRGDHTYRVLLPSSLAVSPSPFTSSSPFPPYPSSKNPLDPIVPAPPPPLPLQERDSYSKSMCRLLERSVFSDRMVFVRAVHKSKFINDTEVSGST